MEDIKNVENQETENKEVDIKIEVVKTEDIKTDKKTEDVVKDEVKTDDVKEEEKKEVVVDTKYDEILEKLRVLEESNKLQSEQLNTEKIKNTIMENISDKELQRAVLETGLVKSVEDIEKVMKIVEMSKTLNKSVSHKDGYKPTDEVTADAYQQAQAKGDIFSMIKQKMSKQ